ncbi:Putative integrase regulator R protein [Pseudomonas luteola]|uniref:Integrase regulator R protein n=1 Tax=Pseudomonas luteola TaxID=47886 RepID=A0A2X2C5P4_PSELU|nr:MULTISPECIES: DUF3158 family protein [Pseudomonas]SPZ02533.1 Putative integrase regulator R protein [Pseudomonas luteola]
MNNSYELLGQPFYQALEYGASLKGLLKPFKGKGELDRFVAQCQAMQSQLTKAAMEIIIPNAAKYPFSLLPIRLMHQTSKSGVVFLRWRRCDRSKMGTEVWQEVLQDPRTSFAMASKLHALEQQRILLNMQMSLIHTISRQAAECAKKMEQADEAYNLSVSTISKKRRQDYGY